MGVCLCMVKEDCILEIVFGACEFGWCDEVSEFFLFLFYDIVVLMFSVGISIHVIYRIKIEHETHFPCYHLHLSV